MNGRRPLLVRRLGVIPYVEAWDRQRVLVAERKEGRVPDHLLLLEHPSVYTFGKRGDLGHVDMNEETRRALGIDLVHSDRGGDVTWHGPGQLVGYPVIDLSPDRKGVARYIHDLEEVIIRTCADFGVEAGRADRLTGVWARNDKVAAIGVRISRWITSHGFAFNVCNSLEAYDHIVPCGIRERGVTTLSKLAGRDITVDEAAGRLVERFAERFDRRIIEEEESGTTENG